MAYNTKYYSRIRNLDDKKFTIYLKQDGYGGSATEIEKYPINPLSLTYRASSKEDDLCVHGSEVNFTFYSDEGDNFDDLFESEIRDWQVVLTEQKPSLINTPIDLQTFTNTSSGANWANDGTDNIKVDLTSFLGAPATSKRATYPLYLQSGDTVNIQFAGNYTDSAFATATVQYQIGLLNSGLTTIINSKTITIVEPTTTVSTGITLTATTQAAYYIFIHALLDYPGTSTGSATIRATLLQPSVQNFQETNYWTGWLQPDSLTRKFVNPAYFININATDGLAELKDITYPADAITGTTGSTTVPQINIIKTILNQTGIPLSINSQLNYRTNTITGSDSLLSGVYANQNRFVKNQRNGKTTYLSCYDALSYILESYNARISQVNNTWSIIQKNEINSPLTTFNWSNLSYSRTDNDRTVNIDSYKSKFDSDELSKVRPIKQINLTFYNANIGENVLPNGYFTTGITGWNNPGYMSAVYKTFAWSSGNTSLYTQIDTSYSYNPSYGRYVATTDDFTLEALSTGSSLNVSFDFNLASFTHTNPSWLGQRYVWVDLMSGSTIIASSSSLANKYYYTAESQFTYTTSLPFSVTGNYHLQFTVGIENNGWQTANIYWDNVVAVQEYPVTITYDKYYEAVAAGQQFGIQQVDKEIFFADGIQNNDVGNLKYNPTGLTTTWSNHDNSVLDKSFQFLYCYEKLKSSRFFKNYLRITVKADTDINFNSVIEYNSKNYMISGYSYAIQTRDLSLELIEILDSDFTMNFSQKTLLSVDGEVD